MTWEQHGFAVISDTESGLPLAHDFRLTLGEAKDALEDAGKLPANLRENLRIVAAKLLF